VDERLVIQAQRGDEAAFAAITASSYGRLQEVAYRILRDAHLAEDATQQALVDVWRNLPKLRDPAKFEAWAYRTLVRRCYREARKHRDTVGLAHAAEPIARDDYSVISDRDQLERAFMRLSMDHRTVVVLHHYLGLTLEQVAEALDIPVGTVNSRLNRAMAKLRHALEADAAPFRPARKEVAR
jgi:RNA polymerase sigma-70 factor (ECF subfamily)